MGARARIVAGAAWVLILSATVVQADDRPVVWCFGDSISRQLCSGVAHTKQGRNWQMVNHGMGGETSTQGIKRLIELLHFENTPDVVFVQYGTNDILAGSLVGRPGNQPADVFDRLERMEAILERYGVDMIWTTTPVRARADTGDAFLDDYLHRHSMLNRKIKRVTMRSRPEKFQDFGHPKQEWVDTVLAPRLARKIERVLRKRGFNPRALRNADAESAE